MKMKVLLKESIAHLTFTLKNMFLDTYGIKTINAKNVIEGKWTKKAFLFIMPGGADLLYLKKLNGPGNKIIKDFVTHGGAYLGICAGSYYGASYVEFDKGGNLRFLVIENLLFLKEKQ